jgi:hypothetical protein
MSEMAPPDLDELRWRRISQGVMNRLEADARRVKRPALVETLLVFRWVAIGGVALVAFAIGAVLSRARPHGVPPPVSRSIQEPSVHTITTGPTPFAMTVPSGLSMRLSENARVLARSTVAPHIELDLEYGELDVQMIRPLGPEDLITIRTPVFVTQARSTDFTVGYYSTRFFVAVRGGSALVRGGALVEPIVVHQGERRSLNLEGEEWMSLDAQRPPDRAEVEQTRSSRRAELKNPRGSGAPARADVPTEAQPTPQDVPPLVRTTQEGETSVQVVKPSEDALAAKWREASEAYYQTTDLDQAVQLATEVAKEGGRRPEVGLALEMLCEAHLKKGEPERAIGACSAQLERETDEAQVRLIHYNLATIYRTQMHDCRQAIPHYNRAIVFGRSSLLDDEALIWRASCALDIGDLESARTDIGMLERRAGTLARPEELASLKKRLLSVP